MAQTPCGSKYEERTPVGYHTAVYLIEEWNVAAHYEAVGHRVDVDFYPDGCVIMLLNGSMEHQLYNGPSISRHRLPHVIGLLALAWDLTHDSE